MGSVYIAGSSIWVTEASVSVAEAGDAELFKGLAFIWVTAALLLAFSLTLFRRLRAATTATALAHQAFLAVERRATVGLFAAGVAHDFNNVLMVFRLGLSEIREGNSSDAIVESMEIAAKRAEGIVNRLAGFAKSAKPELSRIEISQELSEVHALMRIHHDARACTIELDAPTAIHITLYPVLLHQIVMNLVMNAVAACPTVGGRVVISVEKTEHGVRLEVADNGPGLPDISDKELFAPFYTTKSAGTGLGLPSVKHCVDAHGGTIKTGRSSMGGALFTIELPDLASLRTPDE